MRPSDLKRLQRFCAAIQKSFVAGPKPAKSQGQRLAAPGYFLSRILPSTCAHSMLRDGKRCK